MKIDPFCFRKPKREVCEVCIVDDLRPEIKVELKLQALSIPEEYWVVDRCEELVQRYITGSSSRDAVSFPAIDADSVKITRGLCQVASVLEVMQIVDTEIDRYSAEQFIAMSITLPKIWLDLVKKAEDLQGKFSISFDKGNLHLLQTALKHGHWHPEIICRWDRLLCSINDRLKDGIGENFEPLGFEWLGDLVKTP